MSEKGRPGIVHHPVNQHLAIGPVGGISFILRADIFVMSELRLFGKFLCAGGWPVALVEDPLDVFQSIVALVGAGVKVPVLIDRPQLVGRYEFLETLQRWNGLVVPLFGRRAWGGPVLVAEPIVGRSPHIWACHVNPTPGSIHMRDGVDHGILPVLLLENLVIVVQYRIRRQTIASTSPYHNCRM